MCSCTHTRVTPFPWNDCFLFCFFLRSLPKPQKNALGNANTSSQHHMQLTNGCSPLKTRCNNFCFFRCRNTISIISNLQCCLFFFFLHKGFLSSILATYKRFKNDSNKLLPSFPCPHRSLRTTTQLSVYFLPKVLLI